jgi:protein-tyrosine phosphatase
MPDRHIEFERCFNFRDLGGYEAAGGRHVRWRRLFRSMTPEYMTEADVAFAREHLGLRKVLDLRRPADENMNSGPLGEPPARRKLIALADARSFPELKSLPYEQNLARGIELNGPYFVEALSFLADGEDGAALFHCHTGKDRTGQMAAVLLKLLGVSDADVIEDYMHSVKGFAAMRALGLPIFPDDAPSIAKTPPEMSWILGLLAALEKQGGAEVYLRSAGASDDLLSLFREGFLE